jgi:hypothetical protein
MSAGASTTVNGAFNWNIASIIKSERIDASATLTLGMKKRAKNNGYNCLGERSKNEK